MFFFLFSHKVQAQYNYQTNRITTDIGKAKKKIIIRFRELHVSTKYTKEEEKHNRVDQSHFFSSFLVLLLFFFLSFFIYQLPDFWTWHLFELCVHFKFYTQTQKWWFLVNDFSFISFFLSIHPNGGYGGDDGDQQVIIIASITEM